MGDVTTVVTLEQVVKAVVSYFGVAGLSVWLFQQLKAQHCLTDRWSEGWIRSAAMALAGLMVTGLWLIGVWRGWYPTPQGDAFNWFEVWFLIVCPGPLLQQWLQGFWKPGGGSA